MHFVAFFAAFSLNSNLREVRKYEVHILKVFKEKCFSVILELILKFAENFSLDGRLVRKIKSKQVINQIEILCATFLFDNIPYTYIRQFVTPILTSISIL